MGGQSTERALDFKGSTRRLLRTMAPERLLITIALLLAVGAVTLNVIGPRSSVTPPT